MGAGVQPLRPNRMGESAWVQAQITSASDTASLKESVAEAGMLSSVESSWARDLALARLRPAIRISEMGRTRGMATAWALAWTPVPRMARTPALGRASRRVARAEPAAVRMAVMCSPSMMAAGAPVWASKTAIRAWWLGTPRAWLWGNMLTSLTARECEPGR